MSFNYIDQKTKNKFVERFDLDAIKNCTIKIIFKYEESNLNEMLTKFEEKINRLRMGKELSKDYKTILLECKHFKA